MVSYLAVEEKASTESEQTCNWCCESILHGEEMYEVLIGKLTECGFELAVSEGELEFDPTYYHQKCCEEAFGELLETTEDIEPYVPEESGLKCSVCESGIRLPEDFGRFQLGVLQQSPFSPNGQIAEDFHPNPQAELRMLCMYCMQNLDLLCEGTEEGEENGEENGDEEEKRREDSRD